MLKNFYQKILLTFRSWDAIIFPKKYLHINEMERVETSDAARVSDIEGMAKTVIDLMRKVDALMTVSGISRQEKREFWREFAKNTENRERLIVNLAGRIRGEQ